MAVYEAWVLDGVALTSGNFDVMELTADPPKARPDWISAADSEHAALMRQPYHENRTITMKLRITPQASMDAALDQIGAIRDKCRSASANPDGIDLVWTPANSTRSRTFDVLHGEITEMPIGVEGQSISWFKQRPIITLELTCKPYWFGTEVLTSTATASTPGITLEIPTVPGDIPALGRLIVTDAATQHRRHVEWGLEGPLTYNSGTSLLIDSDSMTVSGFAGAQTTQTGAYDPNATGNNAISVTPTFQPVAMAGTGNQTHVGTFKVKARMWLPALSNSAGTQITGKVRLSWAPGSQPLTANLWVSPRLGGRWEEIDLGYITIPTATVGSQRWVGQVEIQGFVDVSTGAAGVAYLDFLQLIPVSDGYGVARATLSYSPGVVVARDDFTSTTASVALSGRVAPQGGTWVTAGDATDFVFRDDFGGEGVARSTISEANGRFAVIGTTNYTDVEVSSQVLLNASVATSATMGVIARYTDTSNYLRFSFSSSGMAIDQIVVGVRTRLAVDYTLRQDNLSLYVLRMVAFASGRISGTVESIDGGVYGRLDAESTVVATGGALATGKAGIWDWNASTGAALRWYDAVAISTPAAEPPAIYSTRSLQVRHDDTIRLDSTGTYYGRPPSYRGSRFVVPPGTSRVLVKARRNDVDTQGDSNVTDSTTIQVAYTPRGLVVPRV